MSDPVVTIERPASNQSHSPRRDKFVDLAQRRTVNAIKAIRVIGKLGNRSAYEYTDADVNKIVKALNDEIKSLKRRMKSFRPFGRGGLQAITRSR